MLSSLTEIVCICVCGCGLPHKRRFVIICARRCLKRQRWFHCRRTTAALLPSYSNILLKNVSEMTHVVTFSARAELKLRIHYEIGCGQQQCEYNRYMMFQCAWNTTYPLSVCYIWCCCSEVGEKISQNISAVCKTLLHHTSYNDITTARTQPTELRQPFVGYAISFTRSFLSVAERRIFVCSGGMTLWPTKWHQADTQTEKMNWTESLQTWHV